MRAFNANAALDMNIPARQAVPKHAVVSPSTEKHAVRAPYLLPDNKEKTKADLASVKQSVRHAAKIGVLSVIMFALFSTLGFERVQLLNLNLQETQLRERISDAESEMVRLESEFNSLFSIDSIEKYAEEKLGMVKRQKYQIRFFTNDSEDEIVLFDGMTNM